MTVPQLFLSHYSASVAASESGSKIALLCSTMSCAPSSLNFDTCMITSKEVRFIPPWLI